MPKFPFDGRHQIRDDRQNRRRYKQLRSAFTGSNAWREISVDGFAQSPASLLILTTQPTIRASLLQSSSAPVERF